MFRMESGKKNTKLRRVITSGDGSETRRKPMGNFALSQCFRFFFLFLFFLHNSIIFSRVWAEIGIHQVVVKVSI